MIYQIYHIFQIQWFLGSLNIGCKKAIYQYLNKLKVKEKKL